MFLNLLSSSIILKASIAADATDGAMLLENRYGKQFLRVVAATFYPEYANNCSWVLRKK